LHCLEVLPWMPRAVAPFTPYTPLPHASLELRIGTQYEKRIAEARCYKPPMRKKHFQCSCQGSRRVRIRKIVVSGTHPLKMQRVDVFLVRTNAPDWTIIQCVKSYSNSEWWPCGFDPFFFNCKPVDSSRWPRKDKFDMVSEICNLQRNA